MKKRHPFLIPIGKIAIIFLFVFLFVPLDTQAAWYDSGYGYCRKLTMTAGGESGGVATTTTNGFALVATSTISTLAATSSAGHIFETSTSSGTTTPVDVIITNGTDCNASGGSAILDFYFEKYVETTGEFVLWIEPDDISSTTAKSVLMYYGYSDSSEIDQSDENGTWGALSETIVLNLHEDPGSVGSNGTKDSTANGNHGTDNGSMTTSDQVQGQIDGAYEFDGSNDYIALPDNASTLPTGAFTAAQWVNLPQSREGGFFNRSDAGAGADGKYFCRSSGATPNKVRFSMTTSAGNGTANGTVGLTDDTWNYAVCVWDGSTMYVYINGALDITASLGGTLADPGLPLRWGTFSNGSRDFIGKADDLRFYSEALSAMDIRTIYNNTVNSGVFWTFGSEEISGTTGTRVIRLLGIRLRGIRLF